MRLLLPAAVRLPSIASQAARTASARCSRPRAWLAGCCVLLAALLLSLVGAEAVAQPVTDEARVVEGRVTDAETGEPLPAANLQVEGAYRGTITNREGRYTLRLPALPSTVVVRYIGYATARRTIEAGDDRTQHFALEPSAVEMEEVVVRPGDEDPAVRIMRRVIERKQQWRAELETYRVRAYSRFTVANDTGIVSIVETETLAFWDEGRGAREVQLNRRQTANLPLEGNLPAAAVVTNLYNDNLDIFGHNLIGVTHPDALEHYTFTLEGTRVRDGRAVYDIRVRPQNRLKTAFEGRISVLDEAYAMIEAELTPGGAFLFPPPIKRLEVTFEQQFSDSGGDIWLPVDLRAGYDVELSLGPLLQFPMIDIDQVSRLASYAVNVSIPDSLYAEDEEDEASLMVEADSAALARLEALDPEAESLMADTLGGSGSGVPLSEAERRAYATIDSTQTLEEAFEPSGPLARLLEFSAGTGDDGSGASTGGGSASGVSWNLAPKLWFNRVEAAHAGAEASLSFFGRVRLSAEGGYNLGADAFDQPLGGAVPEDGGDVRPPVERVMRWTYGGGLALRPRPDARTRLNLSYRYGIDRRYRSSFYPRLANTVGVLLGEEDYYDYLGAERVRATVTRRLPALASRLRVDVTSARHFSVPALTSYDLLGEDNVQRLNPRVDEGFVRSVQATWTLGQPTDVPLGIVGQKRLEVEVERGVPGVLASDFAFTRLAATGETFVSTFFRRRLLPNALYLRASAGALLGADRVRQRYGIVNGVAAGFGSLRTRPGFLPYEGDAYVAGFWEHTFRTVPFELLGLRGLAQRGWSLLVFGGHAYTDAPDGLAPDDVDGVAPIAVTPDGGHHEIGVGLSGLFGLFRLDLTKRLDAPGLALTVGVARLF